MCHNDSITNLVTVFAVASVCKDVRGHAKEPLVNIGGERPDLVQATKKLGTVTVMGAASKETVPSPDAQKSNMEETHGGTQELSTVVVQL